MATASGSSFNSQSPATGQPPTAKFYFAYGSNLHLRQMELRCPNSLYYGLGILRDWKWIIGERGFANIVPSPSDSPISLSTMKSEGDETPSTSSTTPIDTPASSTAGTDERSPGGSAAAIRGGGVGVGGRDFVYGMVYALHYSDERRLDQCEGVPTYYVKRMMDIELVSTNSNLLSLSVNQQANTNNENQNSVVKIPALVYIDIARTGTGLINGLYIDRMNAGIADAVEKGMPMEYVRKCLRDWVSEGDSEGEERQDKIKQLSAVAHRISEGKDHLPKIPQWPQSP